MGAAGYPGTSPQFATNGTLAQSTPIGIGTRADKKLHAGFWYAFRSLIGPTGVDAPEPLVNRLFQNYPNPFNPATNISFTVAEENPVSLNVYNLLGARVCSLIHEWKLPGSYRVVWDGRDDTGKSVASGVYFYRLDIGDFRSVKKMLILK